MSKQGRSPYAQEHWQRWEMEAFDLPAAPKEPEPEPEPDMETLLAQVTEIQDLAKKQGHAEGYAAGHQQGLDQGLPQGKKTGFAEGHAQGTEQGYKEGYEKGKKQAEAESARLAALTQVTANALSHLHEDLGQSLLALAVDIAQHVLHAELKTHPDQLIPLVKEVLKDVEQSEHAVVLLLNPDDIALVEQHLAEDLQHHNWRLKANPNISVGGLELQSALGHIDATLETRWRRALARLGPSAPTNNAL